MTHPDSDALVGLLPHRPPFRFVDAIEELTPGGDITARYRVTGEEAFLAGHFPGNPVFPGVIQIEALAQAGAIVLLCLEQYAGQAPAVRRHGEDPLPAARPPRRRAPALHEHREAQRAGGWATGRATVDGDMTCEGRFLFAVA